MSEAQHDLATEFPEFKEKIHSLKLSDAHFAKLFDEYHVVTKAISRSEQRLDLVSELEEERLRKVRLSLKDQLYEMLAKAGK